MRSSQKNSSLNNLEPDSSLLRGAVSISLGVLIGLFAGVAVKTAQTGFFWFDPVSGAEVERIDNGTLSPHDPLVLAARSIVENPSQEAFFLTNEEQSSFIPQTAPDGSLLNIDALDPNTAGDTTTYTVRSGDSLSTIAAIFDVSVATLEKVNGISRKNIKPGTTLTIPPLDGIPYTIQKGDSIGGIASKFKAEAEEIADYNYIFDATRLVAGKKIFIPNGTEVKQKPSRPSSSSKKGPSTQSSFAGMFTHPVPGARVSRGYFIKQTGRSHKGIDWAAPTGTPILAAKSGTIKKASYGWSGGYGNMAVISHGSGIDTLYGHMTKLNVSRGQYVNQGDIIGWVGSTGRSTGPHLHYEVRKNNRPQAISTKDY
jgi:murein DD-endopeptidase MepM/ murein hydrolase activator NlpD